MIKELLLIALAFTIGFTVTFHFLGGSIPTVLSNIYTTIQGLAQPILTTIQNLITNIQQNTIPTLGGIAIGATPVLLVAGKAYSALKNRLTNKVQEVTDQKNLAQLQATDKIDALQTENIELKEKLETLKIPEDKTDLLNQITTKDQEITQLNERALEAERLVNVVMHPTTKDIITRLEAEGYVIRKAVT